ncbi:DUF2309 domain-containing protein [Haloarcula onubensis]|uniref:Probable inorganic carbon transporter subunit DabA n=1 Tax=Haloarcula onubensis TaxID=2950539 RepID=A0ABU2FKQ0_9EURY|nr:DUF2309 domain-containing protein [Halomicroarcula sp. S3CR25-11]MDS0280892.1 DUF2309 domain-containing protein [Halomicroarcula sp. S3CR25-11]
MSTESTIRDSIDDAAATVGSVWPIHSFVTANPLSGFEDQPFAEAVAQATDILGGRGYPSPETFREALSRDQIDRAVLADELSEAGYEADPETLLDRMDTAVDDATEEPDTGEDRVDHVLTKWLSAFLDEGRAHWPLPDRDLGFYGVFRQMAAYDGQIPDSGVVADLPATPTEAIETVLEPHPEHQWDAIFEEQLAALPGWTGFVKQRAADGGEWQERYRITLTGYLAVRLALLDAVDADLTPSPGTDEHEVDELSEAFLCAWEATYREELVESVSAESEALADSEPSGRPDAQLVFCIDTRSEVLRRHLEATGDYETHGYAGFFGIPMEYEGYDSEVSVEACPPIADAQHHVRDEPTDAETKEEYDHLTGIRKGAAEIVESIETNAATAYGFVESAGSGYGLALAARTLVPGRVHDFFDGVDERVPHEHEFCRPSLDGLSLEEQVGYAETAFDLMGWDRFARLVVFTGHAGETANNPFDSSLDCGACAGNPGGPSARVLAEICNQDAVQAELRERGFEIPDDTVFLAGQHNTTTDEVDLYDGAVPESHAEELETLRADLETAREATAQERIDSTDAVRETERKAADWAETRPEWGLAGNAGFVVGPSELAAGLDLDGRAFLHSYDWSTDPDGDALEAIMTAPMVVTQWINCQYYFSTVDTAVYGSGSKITHNPVGNVGVYQGNGGDLMTGLPLQSLLAADDEPYHQPLRLSTVVHAPVDTVTDILADHENVAQLLDNGWLSLTVVDPTRDHAAFHYAGELSWQPADGAATVEPTAEATPAVADD